LISHSTSKKTTPSAGSTTMAAFPLGPSAARKEGEKWLASPRAAPAAIEETTAALAPELF
jgi:hypothetical protein